MPPSLNYVFRADAAPIRTDLDLHALQARVAAEFREMPGLTLTLAQAARLFSIDAAECERVLGALVERGLLATNGRAFARADAGLVMSDPEDWGQPMRCDSGASSTISSRVQRTLNGVDTIDARLRIARAL
jgi:hypothetical protein